MNTPARILIVEDESIVALDLEQQLLDLGYSVPAIIAAGEDAVQTVKENPPDLILMDIQLRDEMDGITAVQEIHKNKRIPVVYLTAYADDAILVRARETEPHGYLVKPFNSETLRTTVEMALFKFQSERKLYDYASELEQKNMLLQLLNRLVKTAHQVTGRQDLMKMACSGLVDALNLPYAFAICIGHNSKSKHILFECVNGDPSVKSTILTPQAYQICQKYFMSDKPWIIQNIDNAPCLDILKQYQAYTYSYQLFILPLFVHDDIMGIFGLGARHIEDISVRDIRTAWTMVTEIVSALETVSITSIHQKFNDVVFHSNISIGITDHSGILEYVNPAFEKDSGYYLEQVEGHSIMTLPLFSSDIYKAEKQSLEQAVLKGTSWFGALEITPLSGQPIKAQVAVWPILNTAESKMNGTKAKQTSAVNSVTNFVFFFQVLSKTAGN